MEDIDYEIYLQEQLELEQQQQLDAEVAFQLDAEGAEESNKVSNASTIAAEPHHPVDAQIQSTDIRWITDGCLFI
jgi:hypothetical protein